MNFKTSLNRCPKIILFGSLKKCVPKTPFHTFGTFHLLHIHFETFYNGCKRIFVLKGVFQFENWILQGVISKPKY